MAEKHTKYYEDVKKLVGLHRRALDIWEIISNEEIIQKTNWIALKYESDNNLVVDGYGAKGITEAKKILKEDMICFLIIRGCHAVGLKVIPIDIIVQWLPPKCSTYDRAKSTFHVEHIVFHLSLSHFFILEVNEVSKLDPELIESKLRKVTNHEGGRFAFDGNTVVLRRKRQASIMVLKRKKEEAEKEKKHDTQREINVFQEIYDTELTYVTQMKQFYEYYVLPMKDVNPPFYSMLATNVKLILDINSPFLEDMKECSFRTEDDVEKPDDFIQEEEKDEDEMEELDGEFDQTQKIENVAKLVELLVKQCPIFKLYLPYINVYTKLVSKAKDLMDEDVKFEEFCRTTKKKLGGMRARNTDIYGFLIMPIQRIPRYQLLMRELYRKTDPGDPNYLSIQDGLTKVGEVARYIDSKKEENEMAEKTIELSQKYKIRDLVEIHRKMKRYSNCKYSIGSGKVRKPACLYIFNDLLLVCGYHPKKFVRVNLCDQDVRCYPSEKDENVFTVETERRRHSIEMKRRDHRDAQVENIQTILTVNSSQQTMSNKFQGRTIFESYLQKEGGGTFSYNLKKRWHVLTTDYKMKYFDAPGGKFKGGYSLFGATVGRGKDETMRSKKVGLARLISNTKNIDLKAISMGEKKECWMYIQTKKRTFFLLAPDVIVLDTWVRVLNLIGCERKDVLDFEDEQWQQKEMERLKSRVALSSSNTQLDPGDFDLPDMFGSGSNNSNSSSSKNLFSSKSSKSISRNILDSNLGNININDENEEEETEGEDTPIGEGGGGRALVQKKIGIVDLRRSSMIRLSANLKSDKLPLRNLRSSIDDSNENDNNNNNNDNNNNTHPPSPLSTPVQSTNTVSSSSSNIQVVSYNNNIQQQQQQQQQQPNIVNPQQQNIVNPQQQNIVNPQQQNEIGGGEGGSIVEDIDDELDMVYLLEKALKRVSLAQQQSQNSN